MVLLVPSLILLRFGNVPVFWLEFFRSIAQPPQCVTWFLSFFFFLPGVSGRSALETLWRKLLAVENSEPFAAFLSSSGGEGSNPSDLPDF